MQRLSTIDAVRGLRRQEREAGRSVALVPTMGFLHEGHLSLVRRAADLADSVWVSIFVNPTQFGPNEDLDRYPRKIEGDCEMLAQEGVAVVFIPENEEIYPRAPVVQVGFSGLERELCGSHRPVHFAGVGLVVAKLFNIVAPEVAVFGQKDAQQALLITRLVEDLNFPVRIEVAPTVREPDGLAMSSRNAYLDEQQRRAAPAIHRALKRGRKAILGGESDPARVVVLMGDTVAAEELLQLEYAECVAQDSLQPPTSIDRPVLLAIAAHAGSTRLIDNLPVSPPNHED